MYFVRLLLLALLCLGLSQCRFSENNGTSSESQHSRRPTNEPEEVVGYAIDPGKINARHDGDSITIIGLPAAVSGNPKITFFGIPQDKLDAMHFSGGGNVELPADSRLGSTQADRTGAFTMQVPNGSYEVVVVALTDSNSVYVAKLGQNPQGATQSKHQMGVAPFAPLLAEDHVQRMDGKILEIKPDHVRPEVFGWMNVEVSDADEQSFASRYPNLRLRDGKIWVMLCKRLDLDPCKHFNEVGAFPRLPTIDGKLLAYDTAVVGQHVRVSGYVNSWATQMNGYRIIAYDADSRLYRNEKYSFDGTVVEVKDDSLVSRMLKVAVSDEQKQKIQQENPAILLRDDPAYVWVYACVCKTFNANQCVEFDHAQVGGSASTCVNYQAQGYLSLEDLQGTLPLAQMTVGSSVRISGSALWYGGTPSLRGLRVLGHKISN